MYQFVVDFDSTRRILRTLRLLGENIGATDFISLIDIYCSHHRVDKLVPLCDNLEASLSRSQADGERLMGAVVGRVLAG